ncbi:MAG: Binding-protein-dependent transport system inner rane component [Pedosphaera sp.]|nr:Binding-protein-dependent transport system inner rane component [Pedosphaera sp.]
MSEAVGGSGVNGGSVQTSNATAQVHLSPNQRAWRRFWRNRPAVISTWFLLLLLVLVIAWPVILGVASHAGASGKAFALRHDPDTLSNDQFQPPSATHWFGTDVHGRDLLSRVFYGAQVSLLVGAVGALVSLVIGVLWGAVAGYLGGRWDSLMMRAVDVLYSLPSIIFVIVLITTLEDRLKVVLGHLGSPHWEKFARLLFLFIGLGAVSWLTMSRIVRGQVLTLRTRPFVEASRALGANHRHILFRHILPNVLGVVIVYLALTIPAIILYESFLSYLGLGIQPPMASWGSLIAEGAEQINTIKIYWWLLAFPGALLVATLLALNFLGDGFRDAWDVRGDR